MYKSIVLASIVLTSKNPGVKYLICIAGTLLVIYVFYRYNVLGLIERMFEKKVESDSIRSIEMQSLIQVWKDDPIRLITGQGFSATFYNAVTQTNEVAVEWSYVNLLRQIGLIPFTLMMIMFLKPIETAIRNKRNYSVVVGYLGYLAVAATNPLLYTSTGMLALLLMTYVAYDYVEGEEWHRKLT